MDDYEMTQAVSVRLGQAYRAACETLGLKGGSGVELSLSQLEHEIKTLPSEKQSLFISTFLKTLLAT